LARSRSGTDGDEPSLYPYTNSRIKNNRDNNDNHYSRKCKAAALFAQATNSNELGFRQYRGQDYIIVWTDGIPLHQKPTLNEKGVMGQELTDEQSAWFTTIKTVVSASDHVYVATDTHDSA